MKPDVTKYLQMTDSEKQQALLDMTVEEAKILGHELHLHEQLHAPARARPELEVNHAHAGYGYVLTSSDGSLVGWDGELIPWSELPQRKRHIAVFVSASAAIYFAGLHEWVVRKSQI